MRPGSTVAAFTAAIVVAAVTSASAHRLDEYLQAARLAIDPDRVELQLDLTPGVAQAHRVASEIDRDRNGVISDDEMRAYAAVVETGITIAVDGAPLHPVLVESRPPSLDALSSGTGTIRVRWVARLPPLAAGAHRLFFRNTHHRDIGVYLANVLVPSNDRVAVTGQDRDVDQRAFTVSFDLRPAPVRRSKWIAPAAIGGTAMAAALVRGRRRRAGVHG